MTKVHLYLLLLPAAAFAQPAAVQCTPAGNIINCRVDRPVVTQRSFAYPAIAFQTGDQVTVNAGGCVQTGGHGSTWKRYVDPGGPNADRLYHGLIGIPGVTAAGSLQRIGGFVGRTFTVGPIVGANSLTLGYEDDGFGDNGYYSHDDGTGNQCKNVGNAWVTITINRIPTPPLPPPPPPPPPPPDAAPFDLEWPAGADRNGIPLNPQWHAEANVATHPNAAALCNSFPFLDPNDPSKGIGFGNPPCTKQSPGVDRPSGVNGFLCENFGATPGKLNGHVNWMPATYTGHVIWNGHKDWTQKGDDDYNIDLHPSNGKGTTSVSPTTIELEFDSDETIDHFSSAWWSQFHKAVDSHDGDSGGPAGAMIDGHSAIAIGLMNLDAEHDAHSELHPVWALAIRLNKDTEFNPNDDAWAIFARNWGNEGFCSQDQHYLDLTSITLFIPGPAGSSVSLVSSDFKANRSDIASSFFGEPGGAALSFQLGPPENGGMIEGSVHLKWSGATAAPTATAMVSPFGVAPAAAAATEEEEKPEKLIEQLPADKKTALRNALQKQPPAPMTQSVAPTVATGPQPIFRRDGPPRTHSAGDPKKAAKDKQWMQAVCAAFGDNVPGAPAGVCASVK